MIFSGFHPNATIKDLCIAVSFFFLPWRWFHITRGNAVKQAEKHIQNYFDILYAKTFDSGRTALQKALEACDVGEGDEVLVQAYTCMVVSNAIAWTGAQPLYLDINNNYSIDLGDIEKKITTKTKAIIIQHTFGIPADLDAIIAIAKKHNLKIIEDCAHVFGGEYNNKKLGTYGDIGMFSFGSDKALSCARGGALISNNIVLAEKINLLHKKLPDASYKKTLQYLWNIPLFIKGKFLYDIYIGKAILAFAKKLSLGGQIIYVSEMQGKQTPWFPSKLANALAHILLNQLKTIDKTNKHRKEIAKQYHHALSTHTCFSYDKKHILLRYPLSIKNPSSLIQFAKKRGVLLGDWYNDAIAPRGCNKQKAYYIDGSCPQAEYHATRSVNLPTHHKITTKKADKIIKIIQDYVDSINNT